MFHAFATPLGKQRALKHRVVHGGPAGVKFIPARLPIRSYYPKRVACSEATESNRKDTRKSIRATLEEHDSARAPSRPSRPSFLARLRETMAR